MLLRLFILFSVVPIIEIWLLIKIGRVIGALPTVLILLAISATGAWLAKSQGLRTITTIRNDLEQRRVPAAAILDGALIFTGGILLLTPGFFTDFLGIFFLIPYTRNSLKKWLRKRLERFIMGKTVVIHHR
jgi:UPF0716 protein FxsA